MNSRKTMMVVIGVLALVAAGSMVAYYQERTHTPGVQIRVDKNGLQIEQR
jgi:hypothetical protein